MEDFDKYLDQLVENFFDTGKLVLNENYWTDTVNIFRNLRQNPQTVDELLNRYYKITNEHYSNRTDEFNGVMVNNEMTVLDFIEGLQGGDIDEEQYDEDGVIFDYTEEIINLDGEEETDTEDEVEPTEYGDIEFFFQNTPLTQERKRIEGIEISNEEDLPKLSIDTEIDTEDKENNLKTLQYILLNNFKTENGDFIDLEGMKSEINNGIFGDVTKTYVEFLQSEKVMDQNGEVNNSVWNIVLGLLFNREEKKLEGKEEYSKELKDVLSFWYQPSKNTKERLNKNSSMRLFNNLVDFGVYKLEHSRGDKEIIDELDILSKKFKSEYGKVPEIEKMLNIVKNNNVKIKGYKDRNSKSFRPQIKELEKEIEKYESEIKKYEKYKDIISQYRSGTPQAKEESLQKYVGIRKESDKITIKGLFGKLKEVFDRSVKDKDYSLDVINNIITRVNDTLYIIYDKDIKDNTKKNKSKKALKTIINSINLKGDAEEIISGLERINTKIYKHVLYEQSFCECEDGIYFKGCGDSVGDRSVLLSAGNTPLKNLIDSTLTVSGCVESLYGEIIEGVGRKISKHDIVANTAINLNGGITISKDTLIEVKRKKRSELDETSQFLLSEFFAIYKNEPDRTNYRTPEKYNKYNEIITGLVEKLNNQEEDVIKESFNTTGGIFLQDYMFYPQGSYKLVWSTKSERATLKADRLNKDIIYEDGVSFLEDEKRLTVRFEITGEGYQWVEGNCNIEGEQPTNESTDRIDNIIENFFDTGNFDI